MIPVSDCQRQCETLRPEIDAAIAAVLDRGRFVLGENVEAFERAWAAYCGTKHCVGVGSGIDALVLGLKAVGVGPSDQVLVPGNVVYGALAVRLCGAEVVLVDVDENTALMDLDAAEAAITPRAKAIVPTHLYGRMQDMQVLARLAEANGLVIVEDACQAHGASRSGRKAGTWSHVGCFSFYPSKNLGAFGEAGAVVTDDADLAESVRLLRNYGQRERFRSDAIGTNSRLDELQAVVLCAKLGHLDRWNDQRRRISAAYHARLSALTHVRCFQGPPGADHACHLFVVRCDRRDDLRAFLSQRGVATQVHYPIPVHLQPAFAGLCQGVGSFPTAEQLCAEVVSLPLFPELSAEEIESVVAAVEAFEVAS